MKIAAAVVAGFCCIALTAGTSLAVGECKTEISKWCKGVKQGGAIYKCLKAHDADLSAACKAHVADVEKKKAEKKAEKKAKAKEMKDGQAPK